MTKKCFACKQIKNKSEFNLARGRKDKCSVYCKDCTSKKSSKKYKSTLLNKNCERCGKPFLGNKNQGRCSRGCRFGWKKPITGYKECGICKSKFPYRDSLRVRGDGNIKSAKSKFCSRKCSDLATIERNKLYRPTEEVKRRSAKLASLKLRGRKHSEEHIRKRTQKISGSKSHFWKGGVTPINKLIRSSMDYKLWREAVFKRDDFTCLWCGVRGNKLHADHIKPFAFYPELRFAIDNGRTLCVDCHKKTDTYLKNKKLES